MGVYTSSDLSFPKERLVVFKNKLYVFGNMVIDIRNPTILFRIGLSNPLKEDRMYDHVLDESLQLISDSFLRNLL